MNQMKQLKAAEVVKLALISIGAAAILVLLSGADPLTASKMFFNGIFGSTSGFGEVFVKATPLILTGLGCSVAFRTGFFNIGGEGQFYIGALASAWVAINATAVPGVFRIILAIACGFLLGGLWALAAAILKAKLGISEIICTIMLNYISINLLGIAVRTFLMDPAGSIPQSEKIDASAVLLRFLAPTRVHTGILLPLVPCSLFGFSWKKQQQAMNSESSVLTNGLRHAMVFQW